MSEKLELKETRSGFSERDLHSKAILNNDRESYLKYRIQKNRVTSSKEEMKQMRDDVDSLKQDISDIKSLLLKITEGRK